MATNITPIDPDELIGKGVTGLPDAPELSTTDMQEKFDELSIDIIIPHINGMVTEINAAVDGVDEKIDEETTRAVLAEAALSSSLDGKMSKATYDANNDGVVDNSERLDGKLAAYYATAQALSNETQRATQAENNLSTAVNSKASAADLTAEVNRATNAEQALSTKIGDMTRLRTEDKTSLVGAINEIAGDNLGLFVEDGQIMCRYYHRRR